MVFLPLELISLIIKELYHIDRKSVAPMCFVWPHATPFIQETLFRSITIIATRQSPYDDQGRGAHIGDLLAKPLHITRLVHHLTIDFSKYPPELEGYPEALPVSSLDLFSRLPNLTSLSVFRLNLLDAEDEPPFLLTALSRCPISSLKLFDCQFCLSVMNKLLHHLPRLRCLHLDGIIILELLWRYSRSYREMIDFDDGSALHIDLPDDAAYIHVDELCLDARSSSVGALMDLYSHRKYSPLACVRKLIIRSDKWTPLFVGRINRLVARATSDFSLECLEIRAGILNHFDSLDPLAPIQVDKLKTLHLHFPPISGNNVRLFAWHTSTLLNLPPTIAELILIVSDFEEDECDPAHSEAWLNLDAALCEPKVALVPKLTIFTAMKEFKVRALLPMAHARFPMAFRS